MLYVDLSLPQIIGITADKTIRHTGPIAHLTNPRLSAYLDVIPIATVKCVFRHNLISGWPRRLSSFLRRLLH